MAWYDIVMAIFFIGLTTALPVVLNLNKKEKALPLWFWIVLFSLTVPILFRWEWATAIIGGSLGFVVHWLNRDDPDADDTKIGKRVSKVTLCATLWCCVMSLFASFGNGDYNIANFASVLLCVPGIFGGRLLRIMLDL